MIANARLWLDDKDRLCSTPPTTGRLLAVKGQEIPAPVATRYNLSTVDGEILQKGKPAQTPKSTPDALIADRDLWVAKGGVLLDEIPVTGGVRLAVAGEKVPRGYVVMYGLVEHNGRICQKAVRATYNKMVAGAANK